MSAATPLHFIRKKREKKTNKQWLLQGPHRWHEAAGGTGVGGTGCAPLTDRSPAPMMLAPNPHGGPMGGISTNESHWPQSRTPCSLSTCCPGIRD